MQEKKKDVRETVVYRYADVGNDRYHLKCEYFESFGKPVPRYLHCHTEYEYMLILDGKLWIHSGAASFDPPTPCVVIHRPYSMHSVEMLPGADYKRYIFYFPAETLWRAAAAYPQIGLLAESGDVVILPVPEGSLRGFVTLMDSFCESSREDEEVRELYAVTALARLNRLSPLSLPPVNARTSYIQDVIAAIHVDSTTDLRIETLAERFFVSPSKLTHDFRRYAACSVHEYVTLQRLNRACDLLRSGLSVKDAASACGWTYVSAFIRAFRARYGVTPKEYARGTKRG